MLQITPLNTYVHAGAAHVKSHDEFFKYVAQH